MEILSSLKKQPNINEAVLRVSRPLLSFQSTLEVTALHSTTGKQSWSRRWETAIAYGQACVRGSKRYREKVEERRRKGQTHHQRHPRTPLTFYVQAKYVPYHSCVRRSLTTFAAPKKPAISTTTSSKINSVPPSITSPAIPKIETRTAKGDGVSANWTGDKTRDRCIELLYDALALESGARTSTACLLPSLPDPCYPTANDLIAQRAVAIEKAVADELGVNTGGYKAKIRSLFVNLKDKNNPSLRESVVSGDVSPIKFANMTSEVCARRQTKKCG